MTNRSNDHRDPPDRSDQATGRAESAGGTGTSSTHARRPSRAALILGTVVVSVIMVVMLLAVTEVVLRWMRPPPRVGSLVLDPTLGWDRFPPTDPQVAATATSPSPPLRVLCMGDSFTHNTAWSRMLIEELNRRGLATTGWEAGVSGFGQVQQSMKLERLLPELQPDLTVLLFYGWNDPRDNTATPSIIYNQNMLDRPFLAADGSIEPPSAWGMTVRDAELYRRLLEGPIFSRRLQRTWRAMSQAGADPIAADGQRLIALYSDAKTWMPLYMPSAQHGAYMTRAWEETERAMRRIDQVCRDHGSALIVAGVDAPFTIDRDVFEEHVAKDPLYRADDFDPGLPLARFARINAALGISEVTVAPALAEFARAKGGKIYDGGPGNLAGHFEREPQEVMVRLLADSIEAWWRASGEAARSTRRSP